MIAILNIGPDRGNFPHFCAVRKQPFLKVERDGKIFVTQKITPMNYEASQQSYWHKGMLFFFFEAFSGGSTVSQYNNSGNLIAIFRIKIKKQ